MLLWKRARRVRVQGGQDDNVRRNRPALFLVEFVAHDLGELFELTLRLCIVGVDDEGLEMPEAPAQVFETLALLEVAGYFGADLVEMTGGHMRGINEARTFHVFVSDSESLRFENATKDLLPWGGKWDEWVSMRNDTKVYLEL